MAAVGATPDPGSSAAAPAATGGSPGSWFECGGAAATGGGDVTPDPGSSAAAPASAVRATGGGDVTPDPGSSAAAAGCCACDGEGLVGGGRESEARERCDSGCCFECGGGGLIGGGAGEGGEGGVTPGSARNDGTGGWTSRIVADDSPNPRTQKKRSLGWNGYNSVVSTAKNYLILGTQTRNGCVQRRLTATGFSTGFVGDETVHSGCGQRRRRCSRYTTGFSTRWPAAGKSKRWT